METVLKSICENLCDRVDFQVLVANTSFRTEKEFRKFRSSAQPAGQTVLAIRT